MTTNSERVAELLDISVYEAIAICLEVQDKTLPRRISFYDIANIIELKLHKYLKNKASIVDKKASIINTLIKNIINELCILYKYNLSESEESQVKKYIDIFIDNSFEEHYQVNNYITNHNLWNEFSKIRSLNDHGLHKRIPGILPKYFKVVCEILSIIGAGGAPLDKSEPY